MQLADEMEGNVVGSIGRGASRPVFADSMNTSVDCSQNLPYITGFGGGQQMH